MDFGALTEFRELWFPSPRIRLPELAPAGPVFIEGGRCISGALGEYTKLWIYAAGRWHFYYIHPMPRDFFQATMPEAVRPPGLEAQDDPSHRPGLLPRAHPPRGRAPPPHQPRRPRGRLQVLLG